ncbi:hypothetical protein O9G_002776 [Rozella allomycis CSF55]|uniref:Thioredoxin domain-containing protein n=1 Tax=Rozella allomycis (strain CSF55) TaxID=988480 RepID=A0A075AWT4_ROZAC|nr:hypothetical protein O9G_002776 [Rozella allomycis CSF55]|eukprot:EPZ34712.1 hypothetical protein O9G_002776 [Rozella allomycis CSF55]
MSKVITISTEQEFDRILSSNPGKLSLAAKYQATSIPYFIFLKNKNKVDSFSGANPAKLEELLTKHSPKVVAEDIGIPGFSLLMSNKYIVLIRMQSTQFITFLRKKDF